MATAADASGETTTSARRARAGAAETFADNIRDSRTNFLVLMLAQLYCLITIESTQDAALLSNSKTQKLPILETSISIETFYILAPLLLLVVYFNFIVHLKSFWLSAVKGVRAEGADLQSLIERHPWFVTSSLTRRFARLEGAGFAGLFEYVAALIFAFFSTAIVIFMMWARFLTKHDWPITIYHAALTATALAAAFYFLYSSKAEVQQRKLGVARAAGRGLTVLLSFAAPFAALLYASWWLFEAQDRSRCQQGAAGDCSIIFLIRERLNVAGLDPAASLDGVDLSVRPEGWLPRPKTDFAALASVQGADLRGEDLRYASAKDALFVRAKLEDASLRFGDFEGAWFQGATMAGADLSFSLAVGAHFDHAEMDKVRFESADLSEASFFDADLKGATIKGALLTKASFHKAMGNFATFEGADLRAASFEASEFRSALFSGGTLDEAVFSGARFDRTRFENLEFKNSKAEGARFGDAVFADVGMTDSRFRGADFHRAQLSGVATGLSDFASAIFSEARVTDTTFRDTSFRQADFRLATFETVDFSGADLREANFDGATLSGVTLTRANLDGATFNRADLSSVEGLTQGQLNGACGDRFSQTPPGLRMPSCAAKSAAAQGL